LPDASAAHNDVAVDIRIQVFSVDPSQFFFSETVVNNGVTGAYRDTVTATIAESNRDRSGLTVDYTPYAHHAVMDAKHASTAFILDFFNTHSMIPQRRLLF